jgi:hypothetical protein
MRLSDPSFEFVPEQMTRGILAVHRRLKAELAALLSLRTVYGDLIVCRVVAANNPWTHNQLSPYQHLRLAWLQLKQLTSMFDHCATELDRLHDETLELLSIDLEREAECGAPTGRVIERSGRADRWFEVMPQGEAPMVDTVRIASELSIAPVPGYCDAARRDLLEQIDATEQIVHSRIAGFLSRRGGELTDLIGRYNEMIRNLQLRSDQK